MRYLILMLLLAVNSLPVGAQSSRIEAAEVRCSSVLGIGVETSLAFCDVLIQEDPGAGITVIIPPHRGEAKLSFNLHNRHAYSEAEERGGRAYAEYTAAIAVATADGQVLARRFILSEFRSVEDLVDRVTGGAGPSGIKAIAPTGLERIFMTIPAELEQVAIVGQTLDVVRLEGRDTFSSVGRPVAIVSDVQVEYQPR